MRKHLAIMGLCALLLGTLHAPVARAAEAPLTVFAAASTTNALTDIAAMYAAEGHGTVQMSFASSSTLAKQIENGAPADIFLSANAQWMDYLASKDMLVPDSRADLLGNSIVLIAPASYTGPKVEINAGLKLAALLGAEGRLSVGDPSHVPVGTYAKAALEKLGLWASVAGRIAPAKDVRAGLRMVEEGECPLGIVYASDVAITGKVRILGTFPTDSHPNVDYPVAIIKARVSKTDAEAAPKRAEAARAFVAFMQGPKAKAVWAKYGFTVR